MRSLSSLIVAFGLAVSTVAATAMPVVDLKLGAAATEVAYGCGPGMTRGPYGGCRPRFTCPPGFHTGPYGFRCFRNRY